WIWRGICSSLPTCRSTRSLSIAVLKTRLTSSGCLNKSIHFPRISTASNIQRSRRIGPHSLFLAPVSLSSPPVHAYLCKKTGNETRQDLTIGYYYAFEYSIGTGLHQGSQIISLQHHSYHYRARRSPRDAPSTLATLAAHKPAHRGLCPSRH